jgi:predicted amidophosphoribosyltransferase
MEIMHPRIARERVTIEKMTHLYCSQVHQSPAGKLCSTCQALMDYAFERLRKCPFQENKSTCAKCVVHCYKPVMRERVRVMMRYAGPRMLLHHPVLAILHLMDGKRTPPTLARKPTSANDS